jgi:glycosyltransferase involved in cell wall biosynthesis
MTPHHANADHRSPCDPIRVVVLAHASVLDRTGYARRVMDSAALVRRAFPAASVVVASVESPRALRDRDARAEVSAALGREGVELSVVHGWPRRWGFARASDALAAKAVQRSLRRLEAEVVHAHGARATRTALRAAGGLSISVVADVHGDRAAETRLERGVADDLATAPDPDEVGPITDANGVVYASEALSKRFPVAAGRPFVVVPCLVADDRIPSDERAEAERVERRRSWGLAGDEWVAAYAGSIAPWQEIPRLASIVRHLVERVPQFRLLMVTPSKGEADAAFRRAGIPRGRVLVVSPSASDVVGQLVGADAAILLRRPAVANAVAFPTKFAEYVAAGLEVVVSDAAAEVARIVSESPGLGHVLGWEKDDATWAARLAGASRPASLSERSGRRAVARSRLALSRGVEAYQSLYARLAP